MIVNKMSGKRERRVLTEFLKLYKKLNCLWDVESELYRNKTERYHAWEILANKLKELESRATVMTAKKKIDCLRTAYKREVKKVEISKRTKSGSKSVHTPVLWYFNLLKFIDKKEDQRRERVDTPVSDEELQENETDIKQEEYGFRKVGTERQENKFELYETARELLQHNHNKYNPYGIYIGEQLEQVTTLQRHIAEKLISEILFLARTKSLNFESKIETSI